MWCLLLEALWSFIHAFTIYIQFRILDDCSKGALLPLLPLDACRYLLLSITLSSVGATISHIFVIKEKKKTIVEIVNNLDVYEMPYVVTYLLM